MYYFQGSRDHIPPWGGLSNKGHWGDTVTHENRKHRNNMYKQYAIYSVKSLYFLNIKTEILYSE